jgi:hypothetical protein
MKKYFWKTWLRLNLLTKVDNDYVAEVSATNQKTLRTEDIAAEIKANGSEGEYETILSYLNHSDRIIREKAQQGYRIQTGFCHLAPRVLGSWIGANAKYDPKVHTITMDMIPSPELREALLEVGIEVLGVRDNYAYIGLVTDTSNGLTDGTITPGDDILIEGDKIKILPEADGLGVFFVDSATGTEYPVTRRLTQNDPKKVIARVPADLPASLYTLRIVTRFTTGGSVLLNEPRVIEYDRLLIVG